MGRPEAHVGRFLVGRAGELGPAPGGLMGPPGPWPREGEMGLVGYPRLTPPEGLPDFSAGPMGRAAR